MPFLVKDPGRLLPRTEGEPILVKDPGLLLPCQAGHSEECLFVDVAAELVPHLGALATQ